MSSLLHSTLAPHLSPYRWVMNSLRWMEWALETASGFWMWYFKCLGGRSVKLPFTGWETLENQSPPRFFAECVRAGIRGWEMLPFTRTSLPYTATRLLALERGESILFQGISWGSKSYWGGGGVRGRERRRVGEKGEEEGRGREKGELQSNLNRVLIPKDSSRIVLLNVLIGLMNKHYGDHKSDPQGSKGIEKEGQRDSGRRRGKLFKGKICHLSTVILGKLFSKPPFPHRNSQDNESEDFFRLLRERTEIPKYRTSPVWDSWKPW